MSEQFRGLWYRSSIGVLSPVLILLFGSLVRTPGEPQDRSYGVFAGTGAIGSCVMGPEYYEINLISTRKLPGTYGSTGVVEVQFASSPFGVAMTSDGEYVYDLRFVVQKIRRPEEGQYVAWLASPNLDRVIHVGPLADDFTASGQVHFNKYLVIVSLEPMDYSTDRWSGPIALRGLSRSGLMHTSIGHGLFENEPCTQYGFN